jgi:hypothetical protein
MVVSYRAKLAAWIAVAALNLFFVYFTMLRGMQRGKQWQYGFATACVIQFLVEVLLYETTECMCVNFIIPSAASTEIHSVQYALKRTVDNLCSTSMRDHRYFLDAPNYLFVSVAVAKKFPDLLESIIVRSYHHYLPGELAKKWQFKSTARATSNRNLRNFSVFAVVTSFFQLLGSTPGHVQRMVIHSVQPLLFSALLIVGIFFYKHPAFLAAFSLVPMYYCVKYVWTRLMSTDGSLYSNRRGHKFDKIVSNVAPSEGRERERERAAGHRRSEEAVAIDVEPREEPEERKRSFSEGSSLRVNRGRTNSNLSVKSETGVGKVQVEWSSDASGSSSSSSSSSEDDDDGEEEEVPGASHTALHTDNASAPAGGAPGNDNAAAAHDASMSEDDASSSEVTSMSSSSSDSDFDSYSDSSDESASSGISSADHKGHKDKGEKRRATVVGND